MTRCFLTDEKNDIYLTGTGDIAIGNGIYAVLQACRNSAQARLGEMIYAVDKGIPMFETVFTGNPNTGQFEAAVKSAFLSVDGVQRVLKFVISQSGSTLKYQATIETIYGIGELNG